jgi:asparagine synthase (glutamine-hydrolysing)
MGLGTEYPTFSVAISEDPELRRQALPKDGVPVWEDLLSFQINGEWRSEELRTVAQPAGRLAVIGHCLAGETQLSEAMETAIRNGKPEAVLGLPGAYSALVFEGGNVTAVSDPLGQFPMYFGRGKGATVISSSPMQAARIQDGLSADMISLAAHILRPPRDSATAHRASIAGVTRLVGGQMLCANSTGAELASYTFASPDASTSVDEAAHNLRMALVSGIQARHELGLPMSADFSGGVDSTSLAFLAAGQSNQPFNVFHYEDPRSKSGDETYVRRYGLLNPAVKLQTVYVDQARGFNLSNPRWGEDTSLGSFGGGPLAVYYKQIADSGSILHLAGFGGDDVYEAHDAYIADLLLARHPV